MKISKNPEYESQVTTEPLYTLTLEKLEPVLKTWVRDVLAEKPDKSAIQPLVFYSRYEMCKLLKISLPTLGRYMNIGIVTGRKVGNRILFSQEDLNNALHEINRG